VTAGWVHGLVLGDVPTPTPRPGWSLVRVVSSSLNMYSLRTLRAWMAAFTSLDAIVPYTLTSHCYEPVPEWIAGFAAATAAPLPGRHRG